MTQIQSLAAFSPEALGELVLWLQPWFTSGTPDSTSNYEAGLGPTITAVTSITPTNQVHVITGATTVQSILGGAPGELLTLIIPTGQTLTLGGSGNIINSTSTFSANHAITFVLDGAGGKWHLTNG